MATIAPDAPSAPPAAPGPAVAARLVEVHKRFPLGQVEVAALQGVGLDIKAGEFLVILGTERLRQDYAAQPARRPRCSDRGASGG